MILPLRRTTTAALRGAAAVVGVLAGSAVTVVAATGSAQAADTICVALVVDFADLGAGVESDCVKVPDGSSGEDVLRARHTLGFRPNQPGFVCTIDGWPKEGCAASNGEHYWAYFHRAPGSSSWTYSTSGASGYEPRNNSTEGWVWLTRKDQTPANVAFTGICPTSTTSPRPRASTSSPASGGGGGGGGGSTSTKTSASPGDATDAGTTTGDTDTTTDSPPRTDDGKRARERRVTRSASPTSTATPDVDASSDDGARVLTESRDSDDGGSPPYGLLIGGVVVTGLGVAAMLRARRNQGAP